MFLSLFILTGSKKFKLRQIQPEHFSFQGLKLPIEHHPKGQRITIHGQVQLSSEVISSYDDEEEFYVIAEYMQANGFGMEYYSGNLNSNGEWKDFSIEIEDSENFDYGNYSFTIFARSNGDGVESERIETYVNIVDPSSVPITPESDSKPTIIGPNSIESQYHPSDDIKLEVTVTDDKEFIVYYKFDNGEEIPCSDKYPSSTRTGIKISVKIDIPDSLEPGDHTLKVYAKDNADQMSETPLTYNFKVIIENKPRLRNIKVSKSEVYNGEFINIEGDVIYPQAGQEITIKIIFGEYITDVIYTHQSTGTWNSFNKQNYEISSDVPTGKIQAIIRAYHGEDASDDTIITFNVMNDDQDIPQRTPEPTPDSIVPDVPELFAPGSIDAEYKPSQSLPIVVNVTSKYAFIVYYKFDDGNEVAATLEYPQTNGMLVTISLDVEFPDDLSMGREHKFIIYARGDNRKSTEYIYTFNFLEEIIPKIKSLSAPQSVNAGEFMTITGQYENPSSHALELHYKINEEEEQIRSQFIGESPNSISLYISSPSYNQVENKLIVRLFDKDSKLYSRPKTVIFRTTGGSESVDPTNSKPEIVQAPESINENYDVNQVIMITVSVKDEKKFKMCYKFNQGDEIVIDKEYPSTSTPTPVSLNITIPDTLSPGPNSISIYAKDESEQTSVPKTYNFNINADQRAAIEITSVNPESQEYKGFITVSGKVTVQATGKKITLKVIYNDGTESNLLTLQDTSTGMPQNFSITFSNPYSQAGLHTAKIHAETDGANPSEKDFSFTVIIPETHEQRDPVLKVEGVKSIYENDEKIIVTVTVQADSNFKIFYKLGDNNYQVTNTEITKQWDPPYKNNYELTIPENIELGPKILTIYVQDKNEKKAFNYSDIQIIQAKKPYIRECTAPKYNVLQGEKIKITCEIMHPRIGQTTNLYYKLDSDDKVIIDSIILNGGWKTFTGIITIPKVSGEKTFDIIAIDEGEKISSPYHLNLMIYEDENDIPARTPVPTPDPSDNDAPVISLPEYINTEYEITEVIEFDMVIDDSSNVAIFYKFNDLPEVKYYSTLYSLRRVKEQHHVHMKIPFPADLPEGSNTLQVYAMDEKGLKSFRNFSFSLKPITKITLLNVECSNLDTTINYPIEFSGRIRYPGEIPNSMPNFKLALGNNELNGNANSEEDDNTHFSVFFFVPEETKDGVYESLIWAIHNGQESNKVPFNITVDRNSNEDWNTPTPVSNDPPTIEVPERIQPKYKPSQNITFNMTVYDEAGFIIYYKFDSSDELTYKYGERRVDSARNGVKLQFTIDIPDNFDIGSHNLEVYAIDDKNQHSNSKTYSFELIEESRVHLDYLEITSPLEVGKEGTIKGNFRHNTSGENVKFYIEFKGYNLSLGSQTYTNNRRWQEFNKTFLVTENILVGEYTAYVFAIDQSGDVSDKVGVKVDVRSGSKSEEKTSEEKEKEEDNDPKGQPSGGNDQPSGGNDQPSGGSGQPSGGSGQPSGGNDQPSGGNLDGVSGTPAPKKFDGKIIAVIVVSVLVIIIIVAIIALLLIKKKNKQNSDQSEEDELEMEETITRGYPETATIDNPLFTTGLTNPEDDSTFHNDFEESDHANNV